MGFDCTLHVVDEASLARFAARLLRGGTDTAFDRAFERADELIGKTRAAIASDPHAGARTLAELALLFVSAETPHAYSRGFALSIWDDRVMGAKLPTALLGSVEALLEDVLAAHPTLRGRIPRWFDGNYCVGPFVRAKDVPAVLALVERTLDAMLPGERGPYAPLRDVLAVAAARGMAYWEGTDIGVAQANAAWLAPGVPTGIERARTDFTPGHERPMARRGDELLLSMSWRLWRVSIGAFPPTGREIAKLHATTAAFLADGSVIAWAAESPKPMPYVFAAYRIAHDGARHVVEGMPHRIGLLRAACGTALAFPDPFGKPDPAWRPMALRGDRFVAIEAPAPEAPATSRATFSCEAFDLGDHALVVWDGRTYRWDGGAALEPFGPREPVVTGPLGTPSVAPLADGALACVFGREVVRVSPTGERATLLPLTNVMQLTPGLDGALTIHEGNNPEGDALKVFWPDTSELTAIEPSVLGVREFVTCAFTAGGRLLAAGDGEWRALAWSSVRALPRVMLEDFAVARARSEARLAAAKAKRKPRAR